jgi:hypothetical protein
MQNTTARPQRSSTPRLRYLTLAELLTKPARPVR